MVTARKTRADVVRAAGRLFSERGYHGTSMRDLGKDLGLLGSSLYSHVDSKQDLLVEVVAEGAALFQASADEALGWDGDAATRLDRLIAGHIAVILDHIEVSRTFLNEARMLDDGHRRRVVDARDGYERAFRNVLADGVQDGSFRSDLDPKMASIMILSVLNAVERWYRPGGALGREALVRELSEFVTEAISA